MLDGVGGIVKSGGDICESILNHRRLIGEGGECQIEPHVCGMVSRFERGGCISGSCCELSGSALSSMSAYKYRITVDSEYTWSRSSFQTGTFD